MKTTWTPDVSYSQARLGRERSPDSHTVLEGAEVPLEPELIVEAQRRLAETAFRVADRDALREVLAMLNIAERVQP